MRIIITGGNRGVGKAAASALASAGHEVVIACRAVDEGWRAAEAMHGDVEVQRLDLADLASVRKFAESADEVDILINNAGVLGLPPTRTQDGFEAHIGINHLGHFALTCLLGERVKHRIVCVTSSLYQFARLHADDLNRERRRYSSFGLRRVEARQHAVRPRTGPPRPNCLRGRSWERCNRHIPRRE